MKQVTIIGPNLVDQSRGQYVVHAAGCRDIARVKTFGFGEEPWTIDVERWEDVAQAVYADIIDENVDTDAGDYLCEFHFAPCVQLSGERL